MIKVDLITGFLGSGKTTFVKKYVSYLLDQGNKIGIIENDFGAVNVDALVLQELASDRCTIEMIAGGCDRETHRRRFRTKLIAMGMLGFDRVVVEPSGIYDTDEFFDVFYDEPVCNWYEVGNVISVVDAKVEGCPAELEGLFASEIVNAGVVLCSKVDAVALEARENVIDKVLAEIHSGFEKIHCDRKLQKEEVIAKPWTEYGEKEFARILTCGYAKYSYQKRKNDESEAFSTQYFFEKKLARGRIRACVEKLFADAACGSILRIKGYVREQESWYEFNATQNECEMKEVEKGQEVMIVIGKDLNTEQMEQDMVVAGA